MPAATNRRRAGLIGSAVGIAAAGVAAGLAVERYALGRPVRQAARRDLDPGDGSGAFGSLRGTPDTLVTDDGTELYVEIDEPPGGADPNLPTLVFCHGYALNQDSWHFQRAWFRERYRCVFWDLRSHGRSARGGPGTATIDQLGADLGAVLDALCPDENVVVIGHSMGGMALMALAERRPETFGARDGVDPGAWGAPQRDGTSHWRAGHTRVDGVVRRRSRRGGTSVPTRPVACRVVGAALISTMAGGFTDVRLGLPSAGARLLHRTAPSLLDLLARQPTLVQRGRRLSSELEYVVVKRYSFGSEVPRSVARFTAEMIEATPVDVIADFFPSIIAHDKLGALRALAEVPTLVMVGDHDLLTPVSHARAVAAVLPHAELVVVPDAGHVVLLEHPRAVSEALRNLVRQCEPHDTVGDAAHGVVSEERS